MLRILTIDDHEVVRRGLKELFTEASATFGEARSGAEALMLIREQPWDIAVLDISLDGRNGLDVLVEIKQLQPKNSFMSASRTANSKYCVRSRPGRP